MLPKKSNQLSQIGKSLVALNPYLSPEQFSESGAQSYRKSTFVPHVNRKASNSMSMRKRQGEEGFLQISDKSLPRGRTDRTETLYQHAKASLLSRESLDPRVIARPRRSLQRTETENSETGLRRVLSECRFNLPVSEFSLEEDSAINYKITFYNQRMMHDLHLSRLRAQDVRESTISNITYEINRRSERLLLHSDTSVHPSEEKIKRQGEIGDRMLGKINRQLKKLGEKVEHVTKYDDGDNRLLSSNVKHSFEIKGGQEDVLYFKVIAKHKPAPMVLRIYSLDSPRDLMIYVSRVHLKPGKQSYQHCNKPGAIDVVVGGSREEQRSRSVDLGSRIKTQQKVLFENQYFYIGVYTTLGIMGEILVEFGDLQKHKAQRTMIQTHKYLQALKKRKDPFAEELDKIMADPVQKKNFYDKVRKIKRERVEAALAMAGNRNLVQQNIKSVEAPKLTTQMIWDNQKHSEEVRERKKQHEAEDRKKKIFFMIKRDLEKEQREVELQAQEEFNERLKFTQVWPSSAILKTYFLFCERSLSLRVEALVKERRELRLIKHLQKRGQKYLEQFGRTPKQRATKMVKHSMKLMAAQSIINVKQSAARTLQLYLDEKYHRDRLRESFVSYIKQVEKLQQMWNEVMKVARMRLDCLMEAWTTQAKELSMELLTAKGAKGRLKRRELAERIERIKPQHAIERLNEYLTQCRMKHKKAFSAWRASILQSSSKDTLSYTPVRRKGGTKKSISIDPEEPISRVPSNFNFATGLKINEDILSHPGSSKHKQPPSQRRSPLHSSPLNTQIVPPFKPIGKPKERRLTVRRVNSNGNSKLKPRNFSKPALKPSTTVINIDTNFKEQFQEVLDNLKKPKKRKLSSRGSMYQKSSNSRITGSESLGTLRITNQLRNTEPVVRSARAGSTSENGESEDLNERQSPEEIKRDDSVDVFKGSYPTKPPIFRYIPSKELLRSLIVEVASSPEYAK